MASKHSSLPQDEIEAIELEEQKIKCSTYPVELRWSDLTVSTRVSSTSTIKLLKSINGSICGGLSGIMGSSGSGKTTFLSSVSLRGDAKRMEQCGKITINDQVVTRRALKRMSGYVMQDDLLHAQFTVLETLKFTAHLRLSRYLTNEDIIRLIDETMNLMGISHSKNVTVGDSRHQGISGGERKRLCIAMELLCKPSLLFLDEPTSGLDSATALSVMSTLHCLTANKLCTVICTIHQPQSKIFQLLDHLILMRTGSIVYQGAAAGCLSMVASLGFPCPEMTNPADHLIDWMASPTSSSTSASVACSCTTDAVTIEVNHCSIGTCEGESSEAPSEPAVTATMMDYALNMLPTLDIDISSTSKSWSQDDIEYQLNRQPWHYQFAVLLRRTLTAHWRRWDILAMNVLVTVLIAIFTSMSVWRHMGQHKASGSMRMAALFFCVIHQGIVSSLQGTHSFPLERAVMLRERAAGTYHVSAYFTAKTVGDMCCQVISPVLFTCIVYPVIGFQNTAHQFFIFMAFMILDSLAATSLANMISCFCVSIELSTVVMAGVYEVCRLYGGWFISPKLMITFPQWKFADALSYIKYSFVGVALNENLHLVLHCLPSERSPPNAPGPETAANCKIPPLTQYPYDGAAYNAYYGYDQYTVGYCAGILVVYIVVCRILAYLSLRYIKS